jgi:hypothetical protein
MLGRLIYLLILVFFTKTFVKAGFALPGFSANPKSLEILKKDKSFRTSATTKQSPQIFSKRKSKLRGISVSSAEVPLFYFSVIKAGIFCVFVFSEQPIVLNSYLLPSRRGPPMS